MKSLKVSIIIITAIIIFLFIIEYFTGILNIKFINGSEISAQMIVLEKIENIGNLEVVKYNFNDIVEETVKRKLFNIDNFAPDSKVLLIVNGEAAACIDLKKVKKEDIQLKDDKVFITLPGPELCYAKVNHNNSKIYDANLTARILNPELIDKGFKNAEKKIKQKALELGIIEKAKTNGKKLLQPLLQGITQRAVIISYR